MNPFGSRLSALRAALGRTLGRPGAFALVVGAMAFVFSALALAVLTAWRATPFEPPGWMQAEALVLVVGAEGEVDLAGVRSSLRSSLQKSGLVATIDFVGRDAALRELAQRKNLAGIGLAELRPNPLPDAFVVRFATGAAPDLVEAGVAALRKVRSVDTVEFQPELYRRAVVLAQLGARLGLVLTGFLAASSLVAVVLASTFWSQWDPQEVRVLHLLGADPAAFVRPSAYAAGLSLLAAALLAWWIVALVCSWLDPVFADLAQKYGLHWTPDPVPAWVAALICAGVALLGVSLVSLVLRLWLRHRF